MRFYKSRFFEFEHQGKHVWNQNRTQLTLLGIVKGVDVDDGGGRMGGVGMRKVAWTWNIEM